MRDAYCRLVVSRRSVWPVVLVPVVLACTAPAAPVSAPSGLAEERLVGEWRTVGPSHSWHRCFGADGSCTHYFFAGVSIDDPPPVGAWRVIRSDGATLVLEISGLAPSPTIETLRVDTDTLGDGELVYERTGGDERPAGSRATCR